MALPDKPSELIRLASRDLRRAERDPNYIINMYDVWHRPIDDKGHCAVCFAGAVMAFSLEANPVIDRMPTHFGEDARQKLSALNEFRTGRVTWGFCYLNCPAEDVLELDRRVVTYKRSPKRFHAEMEALASDLEKIGY